MCTVSAIQLSRLDLSPQNMNERKSTVRDNVLQDEAGLQIILVNVRKFSYLAMFFINSAVGAWYLATTEHRPKI